MKSTTELETHDIIDKMASDIMAESKPAPASTEERVTELEKVVKELREKLEAGHPDDNNGNDDPGANTETPDEGEEVTE